MSAVPGEYEPMNMNVGEHMAEAARLMQGPDENNLDYDNDRADNMRTAQAHLAFASVLLASNDDWQPGERYLWTGAHVLAEIAEVLGDAS